MDRILIARPHLHCMQCGKNPMVHANFMTLCFTELQTFPAPVTLTLTR